MDSQSIPDSGYLHIVDSLDKKVPNVPYIHKGGKFKHAKRNLVRQIYNENAKVTKSPKKWEIEHFRRRDEKVTVSNAVSDII